MPRLSIDPHEKEILLPPLTGMEVTGVCVEGSVLVLSVRPSVNMTSPTIEAVVSRMQASHITLLDLIMGDLRFAGAPARSLAQLEGLRAEAMRLDPTVFNVAEHYRAATSEALDAQRDAFDVLARSTSMWQKAFPDTEEAASRCISVAMLCARAGEHAAAVGLLCSSLGLAGLDTISKTAFKAIEEAVGACDLPGADETLRPHDAGTRRRLEAAALLLDKGVPPPWPATLTALLTGGDRPDLIQAIFARLVDSRSSRSHYGFFLADPFIAGARVLARVAGRWETGQLSRASGGSFDVKLSSGRELTGLAQQFVLAMGQGGAGGLLCAAARLGSAPLVDLLISCGCSVFFTTDASANTPLHLSAKGGFADVCRLLLKARADGLMHNSEGVAPSDLTVGHWRARRVFLPSASDMDLGEAAPVEELWSSDGSGGEGASAEQVTQSASANSCTALHVAARLGDTATVQVLISGKEGQHAIHAKTNHGCTPLGM